MDAPTRDAVTLAMLMLPVGAAVLYLALRPGRPGGGREGLAPADADAPPLRVAGVLTPAECEALIAHCRAAPASFWADSHVWGAGVDPSVRRSAQGWLSPAAHPVAARLSAVAARLTGLPPSHQEAVQVARYGVGGHFVAHHDACDPRLVPTCAAMNRGAGPRLATLLVYLNDAGLEGGETEFWPRGRDAPGVVVRPRAGTGVLFWNADDAEPEGRVRPGSLHRAHPVRAGEKWIATVWSHARPWPSGA